MGSIKRRGSASGGGGETQYTTFADLSAALLAGEVGDKATLYGASSNWIGTWVKTGASALQIIGPLRLWASDGGAEFAVGADGDGDDIETFNSASAPTWGAAGASTGGLITDGSGAILLPCLGSFDPAQLTIIARGVATTINTTSGHGFAIGSFSNTRSKAFLGGFFCNGTTHHRKYAQMSTSPTFVVGGSSLSALDVDLTALDDFAVGSGWLATDRASNFASYWAGGWRGDEVGTSSQQPASAGTSSLLTGATDHEIGLYHTDAGGSAVAVRWTEIHVCCVTTF